PHPPRLARRGGRGAADPRAGAGRLAAPHPDAEHAACGAGAAAGGALQHHRAEGLRQAPSPDMSRPHPRGPARAAWAIIGGGASGTAMLQALAAHVREGGRVAGPVVLFEAGERPGRGLPYGETADPHHTMGRTRTLRRDKGRQLEARLAQAVATLRGAGVALELRTRTPVLDLEPTAEGHRLHTGEGQREAERVVLATGHWHVPRLAHLSSWVDWQ